MAPDFDEDPPTSRVIAVWLVIAAIFIGVLVWR
jgi:hypothetical protein